MTTETPSASRPYGWDVSLWLSLSLLGFNMGSGFSYPLSTFVTIGLCSSSLASWGFSNPYKASQVFPKKVLFLVPLFIGNFILYNSVPASSGWFVHALSGIGSGLMLATVVDSIRRIMAYVRSSPPIIVFSEPPADAEEDAP